MSVRRSGRTRGSDGMNINRICLYAIKSFFDMHVSDAIRKVFGAPSKPHGASHPRRVMAGPDQSDYRPCFCLVSGSFGKETRRAVIFAIQQRAFRAAAILRLPAARREGAARGDRQRRGQLALQLDPVRAWSPDRPRASPTAAPPCRDAADCRRPAPSIRARPGGQDTSPPRRRRRAAPPKGRAQMKR